MRQIRVNIRWLNLGQDQISKFNNTATYFANARVGAENMLCSVRVASMKPDLPIYQCEEVDLSFIDEMVYDKIQSNSKVILCDGPGNDFAECLLQDYR